MNALKKGWLRQTIMAFVIVALAIALFPFAGLKTVTKAAAGQVPEHSKTATPNPDGTYTLELTVTGDADEETDETGNVNVALIYDVSQSMSTQAQGSSHSRADQAEAVVNKFLTDLAGYQNKAQTNIKVALVTFAVTAGQVNGWTGWTTDVTGMAGLFDDDGENDTVKRSYDGTGTNWDHALRTTSDVLDDISSSTDPTFVILITDGAPTATGDNPNAQDILYPPTATLAQLITRYEPACEPAEAIATTCADKKGTFYGIYAYGTEPNLLDDLMYYSVNGEDRDPITGDADDPAPNYFTAASTEDLQAAIDEIFEKVVQAMGIGSAAISDGTTSQVKTESGEIAELLEVDESSYQYWLSIPVDENNQFKRSDSHGDPVTYTVTDKGDGTCEVTWGESNKLTLDGSIDEEGNFKYEWTEANDLYDYAPPEAELVDSAVDWDLSSVGVLLNGVTYSVTFTVYPSQTTLDIIADIKNDPSSYDDLDAEIKKYIDEDGKLATNTTATLTYDDTRTEEDESENPVAFQNPESVSTTAVEQLAIAKKWENELDKRDYTEVTLNVLRDGEQAYKTVLNDDNNWENSVYISVGIMKDGQPLEGAEGHDFTFTEPEELTYHWELDAPTVHPMLINNEPVILIKVDEKHEAPEGADTYTINDSEYYVDDSEETAGLTATNYRRSSLILTKTVEGENVPEDAEFPFTVNVVNSLAPETEPEDDPKHNSDYWVWISVWDKDQNGVNEGIEGATLSGDGWWYAPSGTDVTIPVKDGYSIRFNNLPTGSTYTFTEGDLETGFLFKSAELEITEGDGDDSTFSGDRTTTGTIENTNTIYTVNYTNEYALVDVTVDKVWDDNDDQDGMRPEELELTLNGAPDDVTVEDPTIEKSEDGNTWTYTWTGVPKYDADGEEIAYTVSEDAIPEGYECEEPEADPDGTITNVHTPETIDVEVTKTWDDEDDADGMRPDDLTLTLNGLPDGVTAPEPTITKSGNDWTYKWADLPKYADGEEIAYTVSEDEVPGGYECEEPEADPDGTITNVHKVIAYTPVTVDPPVQKVLKVEPEGTTPPDIEGKFTFTIEGVSVTDADGKTLNIDIPMPTNTSITNSAAYERSDMPGFYEFGEIEFKFPGIYTYTVSESGTVDGIENDANSAQEVVFTVTDAGDGKLAFEKSYSDAIVFTNKYTAKEEVVTGDSRQIMPYVIGFGASAVVLIAAAVVLIERKKRANTK